MRRPRDSIWRYKTNYRLRCILLFLYFRNTVWSITTLTACLMYAKFVAINCCECVILGDTSLGLGIGVTSRPSGQTNWSNWWTLSPSRVHFGFAGKTSWSTFRILPFVKLAKQMDGRRPESMVRTSFHIHCQILPSAIGAYSNETPHGAQMNIRVQNKTKLYITLSKKDLRFSCGADVDNRHGLYMLERVKNAASHLDRFIFVAATGTFTVAYRLTFYSDLN